MGRKIPIHHDKVVQAFAERLREIRRSHGLTQRELARLAGLNESYLSRLEGGRLAPGIDLVARLARALGKSIADLLPETTPPIQEINLLVDQAKQLFDSILSHRDRSALLLTNQFMALLVETGERRRS